MEGGKGREVIAPTAADTPAQQQVCVTNALCISCFTHTLEAFCSCLSGIRHYVFSKALLCYSILSIGSGFGIGASLYIYSLSIYIY